MLCWHVTSNMIQSTADLVYHWLLIRCLRNSFDDNGTCTVYCLTIYHTFTSFTLCLTNNTIIAILPIKTTYSSGKAVAKNWNFDDDDDNYIVIIIIETIILPSIQYKQSSGYRPRKIQYCWWGVSSTVSPGSKLPTVRPVWSRMRRSSNALLIRANHQ